jgi:hypothetical protein
MPGKLSPTRPDLRRRDPAKSPRPDARCGPSAPKREAVWARRRGSWGAPGGPIGRGGGSAARSEIPAEDGGGSAAPGGVVSAVVPDPGHPQVVAEVAAAALGERSPRSRFRVGGGGEREEG